MVRVISVHNFAKQEITSVDESVDVAAVPPDILLLAQPNNTILVKDLSQINDPGYVIPTVDQVTKIVYSLQGNYIAALEGKVTRNGTKVSYTRVYINWESLKDSKDSFPMRARIAGRVTPLSQNPKGYEMVEIPNQFMPEHISCCPVSGNLLVSSRNVLSVYLFVTQTHDISKIHFIDFKQLNFDLHISFTPKRHQIVEDMIAVQNDEYLHIFRIKSAVPLCSLTDKEFNIDDFEKAQRKPQKVTKPHTAINYEKLVRELDKLKFPLPVESEEELQRQISECIKSDESELAKLSLSSFPVRHEFPTVLLEKSLSESRVPEMFRQNPFTPTKDLSVTFVTNSTLASNSKIQYKAVSLCQYRLVPLVLGSISNREIQEKFTLLALRPYYSSEKSDVKVKQHLLESDHFSELKCVACFFGTQQEGYLQCFEYCTTQNEDSVTCGNYVTYAFTAPVLEVQLDDCFLQGITEVGLETYTLRAAKHLLVSNDNLECPSSNDPVCLIGLHPFVNVFQTSLSENYLTLFANNEESSWTLYQLQAPDGPTVWKDFLAAAEENKWEAPSTYCEMLGEGHLILKTKSKTVQWTSKKDPTRSLLSYATALSRPEEQERIKSLYKESCALLGDYHILNKNYQSCYSYYSMSGYKILEITKRIRGLYENIPEKYRQNYCEKDVIKGLMFFLKKTLSAYDQKYCDFVGNREEFYTSEIGSLVTSLMDLLETEEMASISDLVLDSVVLREFSTDRILKMLKSLLSKSSAPLDKDALSLALMCIQRDQSDQAKTVLLTVSAKQLEALLLQFYDLLFANNSSSGLNVFTELSMILIEIYPNVLATVLSELVTEKRLLGLSKVLKIFLDIIPTGCAYSKNSSFVLQIVLENYFKYYSENFNVKKFDYKTTEAIKILIRIYLTRLQQPSCMDVNGGEDGLSGDVLFHQYRPTYLNQVPPFGPDLDKLFHPQDEKQAETNKREKGILLKLQCILSFDKLPDECLTEVRNFLSTQTNVYGRLSLQVLTAASTQEAINLLIAHAPQPLSRYSRERVKEKEDWKYLVSELLKKTNEAVKDERFKFFLQQILSEILHHVVENLNIEEVIDIIPKEYEDADRYFALAQNNAQANHLKTLIMVTGKQLLASM